jgi:hypothetical protein
MKKNQNKKTLKRSYKKTTRKTRKQRGRGRGFSLTSFRKKVIKSDLEKIGLPLDIETVIRTGKEQKFTDENVKILRSNSQLLLKIDDIIEYYENKKQEKTDNITEVLDYNIKKLREITPIQKKYRSDLSFINKSFNSINASDDMERLTYNAIQHIIKIKFVKRDDIEILNKNELISTIYNIMKYLKTNTRSRIFNLLFNKLSQESYFTEFAININKIYTELIEQYIGSTNIKEFLLFFWKIDRDTTDKRAELEELNKIDDPSEFGKEFRNKFYDFVKSKKGSVIDNFSIDPVVVEEITGNVSSTA